MLPLILLVLGFALGWVRASRRGGNTMDKWQYGAGHAIAGGILGLAIGILIVRLDLI